MKTSLKPILVAATLAVLTVCAVNFGASEARADEDTFKVMSFNIRCMADDGDNSWQFRKETLVEVVREADPAFLGVQEAEWEQMEYLNEKLDNYAYIGVGRDDGEKKGEFMAIFYKKSAVELVDSGTFWLSPTPEKPSKGWDAACYRTATWGKFRLKDCGKTVVYVNTHLDHKGTIARQESAKLLLKKGAEINPNNRLPFFVSGDFNVTETSDAYKTIANGIDGGVGLRDANKVAERRDIAQNRTFHAWGTIPVEKSGVIDFIFVNDRLEVENFKINPDKHSNGRFASDHCSIVATLEIDD